MKYLLPIIREAIYGTRDKLMYKTEAVVGLDNDFMIKAHLMIPEGFEKHYVFLDVKLPIHQRSLC